MNKKCFDNNLLSKISGLCYSGFRKGQNPITLIYPSEAEIEEDLDLICPVESIRIYSFHNPVDIVSLAEEKRISVYPNAWIDKNTISNKVEIEKLINSIEKNHNIPMATIGSEVIKRKYLLPDDLIDLIKANKKLISVPLSTSEDWENWIKYPELAKYCDFIPFHIFPFHKGIKVESAVDYIKDKYSLLKKTFPDKELILYDNGWPTNITGPNLKKIEQTHFYLNQLIKFTNEQKLKFFYFEAFDEPWKKLSQKKYGSHWGLFKENRTYKFD